ncbi:UNVERIFIED_CONTAM: hypothetical protein RMT77_008881 [Armadillidium vulgare]
MSSYVMDFLNSNLSYQWVILLTFCVLNVLTSFSLSIHAPFYPLAAESRGFTPSEYSIVIGIFNFVTFLISPVCGKLIANAGAMFICSSGIFILGSSNILFGFVNDIIHKYTFLSFSLILRIFQGVGYGAFQVSSISIISNVFPNDIEKSFACVTSLSSLGFIIGPAIGGILYEKGGFRLPFITIGVLIILGCGLVVCVLRRNSENFYPILMETNISVWSMLKLPTGSLAVLSILGVYLNTGFIISTLETYMESLNLSPFLIGTMFIYNGVAYSISSFVWVKICSVMKAEYVWSIGAIFTVLGLSALSLKQYFPPAVSIYVCAIGLFIHGIGEGGEIIAALSGLYHVSKRAGFPQDIVTYGIISSLYTSALGIGIFIGSIMGGILYDLIGFEWTAYIYSCYHIIIVIATIIYKSNCRSYSYYQ